MEKKQEEAKSTYIEAGKIDCSKAQDIGYNLFKCTGKDKCSEKIKGGCYSDYVCGIYLNK